MKHLRRKKFLAPLLALLILAGYSGFGFNEHICYSHNERIVSLTLEPEGCSHNTEVSCCNENDGLLSCQIGESCSSSEIPISSDQPVLQGVCCVDKYHFSNIPDEVLPVKPSLRIEQIANLFVFSQPVYNFRLLAKSDDLPQNSESPPEPAIKKILFFHQLRLDPDLA